MRIMRRVPFITPNLRTARVARACLTLMCVLVIGEALPAFGQTQISFLTPFQVPNDATTGTFANQLARINGSGNAVNAAMTDTSVPVFIVVSGAGKVGSATLATFGEVSCAFDSGTTAADFVVASTTASGDCHDAGSTAPTTGWVIGQATSNNSVAGTYTVLLSQGYNALALTNQNSLTLGSGSQTNPSFVYVQSGSGGSNTNPGYYEASGSPANSFNSFLFPCQSAGNWCGSSASPSTDSNKTIAVHGGVNPQTVQNWSFSQPFIDQTVTSVNTFAAMTTTAASVNGSNVATLTFGTDPTVNFVSGGQVTVSGFTGADTYFNGTFQVTGTSGPSKTISYSLIHAAASATSNGSVIGFIALPCPTGSNFADGWEDTLQNIAASGSATIQTAGCNINNGSSLAISNGAAARITSDGTNFWAQTLGSGGSGTVTNFSSGNLSPMFTTSVVTPTTTPALSFALSNQVQGAVLAGPSAYLSAAATPTERNLVPEDAPNPSSWMDIRDEFTGSATTSGLIGQLGWGANGGTLTILSATSANHPYVYQKSTGTTSGTISYIFLGGGTFSEFPLISIKNVAWHLTWIISQDAGSTNPSTQEKIRCGLMSNVGADPPTDGIYFENVSTTSAANWSGVAQASGTPSSSGGTTALDTSFHRFDITDDGSGNLKFYIDNVQYGSTVSTNVTTAALVPACYIKNTEATAKLLDIDFFRMGMALAR